METIGGEMSNGDGLIADSMCKVYNMVAGVVQ